MEHRIPIIKLINNEANAEANKVIPISLIENSFFFVLSSIAGMMRQKFISVNGREQYANFFGVTISSSGSGKDVALKASERMFDNYIPKYADIAKGDFKRLNKALPDGTKANDDVDFIPPSNYKIALRGSIEGMMRSGNFYNRTEVGSLNVVSTEFGNEYNPETIPILTVLWEDAKADGSTNVNEKYPPINDVPTNVLFFGSSVAFEKNEKKHAQLAESIESGFARRCNFVWVGNEPIEEYTEPSDIDTLLEYADSIMSTIKEKKVYEFNQDAKALILAYREKLKNEYNEQMSNWRKIKASSVNKVERLSAIIAIADLSEKIEPTHVMYAIELNDQSFIAMSKIVSPHSQYKQMYDVLQNETNGLHQTEMIDFGIKFKTKSDWEYQLELLEDLAYRKNMIIKIRGKKVILRELPANKLDHMIVSTSVNNETKKPEMEINFKAQEVGFFGEGMTMEALVTSKIKSFCMSHFVESARAPEGHRKKDNFIQGQNMIAFDIDEGLSLADAKDILKEYIWLIYTTKSHQKEKNGIICDRFRIILPTKTNFFVTVEQHKELYENLSKVLNIPTYDVATRNVSRLWYTNPKAEVSTNKNGELLDIKCCIPETEKANKILPAIENLDIDEADRRIGGMMKFVLINTSTGNRNAMMYRLAKFVQEMGGDVNDVVHRTNAMTNDPLPETEVQTIIKNI